MTLKKYDGKLSNRLFKHGMIGLVSSQLAYLFLIKGPRNLNPQKLALGLLIGSVVGVQASMNSYSIWNKEVERIGKESILKYSDSNLYRDFKEAN